MIEFDGIGKEGVCLLEVEHFKLINEQLNEVKCSRAIRHIIVLALV